MEEIKEQARKNAEEKWNQKLQKSFSSKISNYQNKAIDLLNEELNIFDNNIKQHIEDLGKDFDMTWSQKFEKEMTQYGQIINDINNNIEDENLRKKPIDLKNIKNQPTVILKEQIKQIH